MASPPRILLCGDVLGRLNQLFKRVLSVNKSTGPFDALFCVGQFFPDSPERLEEFLDYAEGRSPVPLPTYFVGDYGIGTAKVLVPVLKANPGFKTDGLKICENLYWLKGSGKFSLLGLSIAYLSGRTASGSQSIGTYVEDDIDALRALAEEPGVIDLFLTNEWPSEILNKADTSDAPEGILNPQGSDLLISQLVSELKPRYHIAGSKGVFFARQPYSNDGALHITRFIGLAPVGNKEKQYWRYDVGQKRQRQGSEDSERLCFKFTSTGSCPREEKCNFKHDMDAREWYMKGGCFDFINRGKCERGSECSFRHGEGDSLSHKKLRSSTHSESRGRECWFCLSSTNVESHLVLSIGESCYCALAKGPLVQDHLLIIPVDHSPNTLSLTSEAENELQRYKDALKKCFKNQRKTVVFYEWLSKPGPSMHANLQVVPIPLSKAFEIRRHFVLAAQQFGFEFEVINPGNHPSDGRKSLRGLFDGKSTFFYVELPEGTILYRSVGAQEKFPAQFGREVLAGMLNMTDRADWRNCKLSKEEETQMVESFKKQFEEFDPAK